MLSFSCRCDVIFAPLSSKSRMDALHTHLSCGCGVNDLIDHNVGVFTAEVILERMQCKLGVAVKGLCALLERIRRS